MKKLLLIAIVLFASVQLSAQTDGMSYQAVILNPNTQEVPGANVNGNILPNTRVSIRFTILDANNSIEYQEIQTTSTDQYGMINLLIGKVNLNAFTLISWNGTNKELKVEIDFKGGTNFVDLSREQLTFLPFASHRNITASGTLKVDQATFLNGELTVEEPTHLNSTLDVNNNSASNLTGDLTVGGATIIAGSTNLNSLLNVNNKSTTNLSGILNVGDNIDPFDASAPTNLFGTLDVVGTTTLGDLVSTGEAAFNNLTARTLEVSETTDLIGATTIEGTTVINGITTINNATTINGATIIDNTATIKGATLIDNTATVNGNTTLNSTLDVKNKSTTNLTGALNVGILTTPFDASAPTNLFGTLNVNGGAEFTKNLKVASLWVDGLTNLKGGVVIDGPSTEIRTTSTRITNQLRVDGPSSLTNSLNVAGITTLSGAANLTGATTTISGVTTINNTTTVNGTTNLNGSINLNPSGGQVKITSTNTGGSEKSIGSYPLLIQGGNQGVAIKVNGSRSNANNFISFWDNTKMWGRIEGQNQNELEATDQYKEEKEIFVYKTVDAGVKILVAGIEAAFGGARTIAAATSSTGCVGFGACVTVPIPSLIVVETSSTILKIAKALKYTNTAVQVYAQLDRFLEEKPDRIGITFVSGAGDYAEYLPKENSSANFIPGELVGVKNGLVSKDVWGAEKIMVVSTRPIVLGNMPQPNNEGNSVKIAFMGQVPVKVIGTVAPGDYILPNILANGLARAVHPKDMKIRDYKRVAGVAWNIIAENSGVSVVNIAVGINTNDLSDVVYRQEEELKAIKTQMEESSAVLARLVPGYAEAFGASSALETSKHIEDVTTNKEKESYGNVVDGTAYGNDIVEYEVPRELVEEGIALAMETYLEAQNSQSDINLLIAKTLGKNDLVNKKSKTNLSKTDLMSIEEDPFWQKMQNNSSFKEEIVQTVISSMSKSYHTHKEHRSSTKNFKVRKD